MGNRSNYREVYRHHEQHDSQLHLDIGDMSTGVGRGNSRRANGLELSFDQIEASGIDIIEEIRRESKKLKLKPICMTREIDKLTVGFVKQENDEVDSSGNCCSVCLVPFENGDKTVPLPCNTTHIFHKECLLSWAEQSYTCPICRKPVITSENEIKLYEMMHQRNQMNEHEDDLASGVIIN